MNNFQDYSNISALIVGLGSVGTRHLNNLKSIGVKNLGVYRSQNNHTVQNADLDNVNIYYDYKEALDHGYSSVFICNPTSMHMEYALEAAYSKCNLYIEKPLSNNLKHTEELKHLQRANNLVVALGYQFKFHPNLKAIKEWLGNNAIGQIVHCAADVGEYLPSWHPWENYRDSYAAKAELGGGVALTLIHEIDYLEWLLGDLTLVSSHGGTSTVLKTDVEDFITATLMTPNNTPLNLHIDYLQNPACRKLKIIGEKGIIEWNYYTGTANLTISGNIVETSLVAKSWERNTMFIETLNNFLQCTQTMEEPMSNLNNSSHGLEITLKIKDSITLS